MLFSEVQSQLEGFGRLTQLKLFQQMRQCSVQLTHIIHLIPKSDFRYE